MQIKHLLSKCVHHNAVQEAYENGRSVTVQEGGYIVKKTPIEQACEDLSMKKENEIVQALLDYVKSNNELLVITEKEYSEQDGRIIRLKCDQRIEFLTPYECVKRGLPRQHQVVMKV